jgi:hypothetical protein
MNFLGVIVAVLGLIFLFWGEPDVWDAMHAKAMDKVVDCPAPKPEQKKGLAF